MARNCRFIARTDSDLSKFQFFFDAARKAANGSDMWSEFQVDHMSFHFESQDAHSQLSELLPEKDRHPSEKKKPHKHRLIILGAGFSRPAGFPLATELWDEIRETAGRYPSDQRASKWSDDLSHYIEFRKATDGSELTPDTVDFEDFMRFLDVEHYLGLRGSETWSPDGNEGTVVTKFLIGSILARHVNALEKVPELYLEFAKRLDPHDTIFTFNYDTLLEKALDEIGKPYRLFSTRFTNVTEFSGQVDNTRDEVVIFKVHGSIDWFDRSGFERQSARNVEQGAPPPQDIIFSHSEALDLECIVDGPRHEADPLKNVYRAKHLKALYAKDFLFRATPHMLAPSSAKLLYATRMNDFWEGMAPAGYHNFGMAIIGFSLPSQDEYARQILYEWVTNYQKYNWEEDELGRKKTPIAIVDLFATAESKDRFAERYRFVDWTRADLSENGFNLASLDKIFA